MKEEKNQTPHFYKEKLNELKSKMNILLNRYKKSYPLYKSNPNINEYKSLYQNDIKQIQNIQDEVFLLQSKLLKEMEDKSNKLQNINMDIEFQKDIYNLGEEILNKNLNETSAGKPRLNEYKEELHTQYYILLYNTVLVGVSGYIFYKMLYI